MIKISYSVRADIPADDIIRGFTVEIEMPALIGSERQVAYAGAIREAAIRDYVKLYGIERAKVGEGWLKRATHRTPETDAAIAALNLICDKIDAALSTVTEAKRWIEAAGGAKSSSTVAAILTGLK